MLRGDYNASAHVMVSFGVSCLAWSWFVFLPLIERRFDGILAGLLVGAAIGAVPTFVVYYNRWECVEAYTSRWLSGIAGVSGLYAPFIALMYAYVRGVMKLAGR